jgi:uncharacterized membrane-anchored protein YitT (DUF2179 family)
MSGDSFVKHAGAALPHTLTEDAQAYLAGTVLVALGVVLLAEAKLVTGGTVGLAILLHYFTGIGYGKLFFVINLPFIALALWKKGASFTIRSFITVTLLSVLSEIMPSLISIDRVQPIFAAVAGGLMIGVGLLILFRHQASLGGFNVLALYMQERYGMNAGAVQLVLDGAIVAASMSIMPLSAIVYSMLGAAVLNVSLAVNHRPGRYVSH